MQAKEVLEYLHSLSIPDRIKSHTYYGIQAPQALGLKVPQIREAAAKFGKNQEVAEYLWEEEIHEAKLLAVFMGDPKHISPQTADQWVSDLYSWDVCDQLCTNLLAKTPYAWELPFRYTPSSKEYVRRAGLVMVIGLRLRHKKVAEQELEKYFPLLEEYATDERNFVKKAVNWAIRELGKRSPAHYDRMISLCNNLVEMPSPAARWIARDALRELRSEKVLQRLSKA